MPLPNAAALPSGVSTRTLLIAPVAVSSSDTGQTKTIGTNVGKGLAEGITTGGEDAKRDAGKVAQNVLDKLTSVLGITGGDSSKAQPIGEAVAKGVGTGIKNGGTASKYASAANAVRDAASSALKEALGISGGSASKFEGIGEAIASGVAKGISDNSSKISSAARSAAKSAYNAAKRELGISSPSRKMAEIGRWFDAGFAQGIERNMDEVVRSADRLANIAAASPATTRSEAASFTIDYDRLGEAVAQANRRAGVGTAVLRLNERDMRTLGNELEPYTSRASANRASSTAKGRSGRMVLA